MATFPQYYRPRPYQIPLHQMWKTKRMGVAVMPRQTGKDMAMSNEVCDELLKTPKMTAAYISLNNPMIRDILYDKTYYDPKLGLYLQALQDNVPPELVDWKDTVMEGRFVNKSRLKLQGYFQSGQDKNGVGTAFQIYAFTELALFYREDPLPRLMPIIENRSEEKKLMVASTPRGKRKNPLWALMESQKNNPEFQVITRTIDDCNKMMTDVGLEPVLTPAQLESIRESYLKRFGNDRMFEQEYYCSFEEMDAAAVYGEAYMRLIGDKRIHNFNINPEHPVYCTFDIGSSGMHSDATAWVIWQYYNERLFIYDCGEGHGRALPEYVDVLRPKHYFNQIKTIILPWDAEHHEKAVNTTPADMMRTKFGNVAVLAKSRQAFKLPGARQGDYTQITDIQQTRLMLYNTIIHEDNCQWLLECLENYKYEFNLKMQMWTEKPLHDKHSHMMDALRYTVQAIKEQAYFGGKMFEEHDGRPLQASVDYVEDWRGVW